VTQIIRVGPCRIPFFFEQRLHRFWSPLAGDFCRPCLLCSSPFLHKDVDVLPNILISNQHVEKNLPVGFTTDSPDRDEGSTGIRNVSIK
jgi:hypothetical protein